MVPADSSSPRGDRRQGPAPGPPFPPESSAKLFLWHRVSARAVRRRIVPAREVGRPRHIRRRPRHSRSLRHSPRNWRLSPPQSSSQALPAVSPGQSQFLQCYAPESSAVLATPPVSSSAFVSCGASRKSRESIGRRLAPAANGVGFQGLGFRVLQGPYYKNCQYCCGASLL